MASNPTSPVTAAELDRFVALIAHEVDDARLDPHETDLILGVDDRNPVVMLATGGSTDPSVLAQIDQLLTTPRRMAAAVSATAWSPTTDGAIAPAGVLIAVGRGGLPALAAVRRVAEDTHWTRIPPTQLPWLALSAAGGLRAALEQGTALRPRHATSPALYQRPDQYPDPPLDSHGDR